MIIDTPVFDRRFAVRSIFQEQDEWRPARTKRLPGVRVTLAGDGPDTEWRHEAQQARMSSNRFSGQHDNDNVDWPLQKLLRTEGNAHCLALAERYRALHDLSTMPVDLLGTETNNLYLVTNEANGKPKEVKVVKGRKANVETAATKKVAATDTARKLASPVPKKWNGDNLLVAAIDARVELSCLRSKLGFVPAILEAFEWSVVDGLTLESIGRRLGAGSKGAKGEARARVFDGFGIIDRFWQRQRRVAA